MVRNFSALCGTRRCITVFTTVRQWSLSWTSRIQSYINFNITLPSTSRTSKWSHCFWLKVIRLESRLGQRVNWKWDLLVFVESLQAKTRTVAWNTLQAPRLQSYQFTVHAYHHPLIPTDVKNRLLPIKGRNLFDLHQHHYVHLFTWVKMKEKFGNWDGSLCITSQCTIKINTYRKCYSQLLFISVLSET
jgi:hypothetical protein